MKSLLPLSLTTLLCAMPLHAESPLQSVPLKNIDGQATSLKAYEGKVLLVVNVASECGLTPQYEGLQALHAKYQARGFSVLGFPCNDFGGQEPGTTAEIKTFCSSNYSVTFPMFDKIKVRGEGKHPLYEKLTGPKSAFPGEVSWNFGKFLIDQKGHLIARFDPGTEPESAEVVKAIEKALSQ